MKREREALEWKSDRNKEPVAAVFVYIKHGFHRWNEGEKENEYKVRHSIFFTKLHCIFFSVNIEPWD